MTKRNFSIRLEYSLEWGENTRERADYTFVNVGWVRMLILLPLWLSGCMQMFAAK